VISSTVVVFVAYMFAGVAVALITHGLRPQIAPAWLCTPAALLAVAVRVTEGVALLITSGQSSLADFRLERLILWFTAILLMYLTLWRLKARRELHTSAAPAIQPLVAASEDLLATAQDYGKPEGESA
jgi:uncharacterized membrane protein